jgi:hypothetical protein
MKGIGLKWRCLFFWYILSYFDPTKKLKNEINLEKNKQKGIEHQIMDINNMKINIGCYNINLIW